MTEAELRARVQALRTPADADAEERAWTAVRDTWAEMTDRRPTPSAPHRRWRARLGVPAILGLLVVGIALAASRPPHVGLGPWLREAIGLGTRPQPRPLLAGLPSSGELLVTAPSGTWLVQPNGARRLLGHYHGAAWSPHTRYVVAWRGPQVTVLDPHGAIQWSLPTPAPVTAARWSPDGDRIAYLSGRSLWVVAGDGTGVHRLTAAATAVPPAWEPGTGAGHRLALVTAGGAVQLRDGDTGAVAWTRRPRAGAQELLWSADGRELAVLGAGRLDLYDAQGRVRAGLRLPDRETVAGGAFAPTGDRLALLLTQPGTGTVSVAVTATVSGLRRDPQTLVSAAARITGLSWSPDGRWLLASVPASDQWLLATTRPPLRLLAVSHLTSDFGGRRSAGGGGFPTVAGWQQPGSR